MADPVLTDDARTRAEALAHQLRDVLAGQPREESLAALTGVLTVTLLAGDERIARLAHIVDVIGRSLAGPTIRGEVEPGALLVIRIGQAGDDLAATGSLTTAGHSAWHAIAAEYPDLFDRIEEVLRGVVARRVADLRRAVATSPRALATAPEAEAGHA